MTDENGSTKSPPHGNTDELDRAPIARIQVKAGAHVVSRGTGTLVGPRLVLSALHVVANRRTDPPQPYPGELILEFPDFTTTGTILEGAWDRSADWVLIECAEAPAARPMRLAELRESKREWQRSCRVGCFSIRRKDSWRVARMDRRSFEAIRPKAGSSRG